VTVLSSIMSMAFTGLAFTGGAFFSPADAGSEDPFVESGGAAFRNNAELPWYDANDDEIRPVKVEPIKDDEYRNSEWATESDGSSSDADAGSQTAWQFMQMLIWAGLAALLASLIWVMVWAAMRTTSATGDDARVVENVVVSADQIENLPVNIPRTRQDLLTAARSLNDAGDHSGAIIYAFAYQLVELDRHQLIRLSKGKTNRQYLWELKTRPEIRQVVRPIMLAFEDVFFGHHELSPTRSQECWTIIDDFQRRLERVVT
jgi:hypothetical protein